MINDTACLVAYCLKILEDTDGWPLPAVVGKSDEFIALLWSIDFLKKQIKVSF